jgi:hypothetical protein
MPQVLDVWGKAGKISQSGAGATATGGDFAQIAADVLGFSFAESNNKTTEM